MCSRYQRYRKSIQTVKLTLNHRPKSMSAIHRKYVRRNKPNRPHISSDTSNVKQHSETKTKQMRPNQSARPPSKSSDFSQPTVRLRPVSRPDQRLSAAGEGVSSASSSESQALFSKKCTFFRFFRFFAIFQRLTEESNENMSGLSNILKRKKGPQLATPFESDSNR